MQKSYLRFFKPDGLLVLAGRKEAAQKQLDLFWSERFCLDVPSELVEAVFPFLATLNAQVAELGEEATTSMRSVPQVLQYLAVVLVQDACELASTHSTHPVYAFLREHEAFKCVIFCADSILACSLVLTQLHCRCQGAGEGIPGEEGGWRLRGLAPAQHAGRGGSDEPAA
jgi:hypothetical protein